MATAYSSGAVWGEHFDIDPWGNLYKIRACQAGDSCSGKPQGENLDTTADTSNRLVGLAYDAAGNMTNDGGPYTLTDDAENRIASFSSVTYTYDGDGKRVAKSTGKLYWTGTGRDPLTETDLSGAPIAEYVFFAGKRIARIDQPTGTIHYYFADHLGSANVVTNADGSVIEQESDFYPFGGDRVITAGTNNYKFTGKERDAESALDFFGARYYASNMGRFTKPDPKMLSSQRLSDPQQWNMYAYTRNNPLIYIDPDGMELTPIKVYVTGGETRDSVYRFAPC